jgi:hypothetical protein
MRFGLVDILLPNRVATPPHRFGDRTIRSSKAVHPADVLNGCPVHVKSFVSSTHVVALQSDANADADADADSDADSDPDPDPDPDSHFTPLIHH